VDRIYTRVGASDNLARGRSTFAAGNDRNGKHANTAANRSLILLDEVGRGTATFDGLFLAWAIAEYLVQNPIHRAKTLFATHYHELTKMEEVHSGVKNYCMAIQEAGKEIVFLRKVTPGVADKSYGIEVARLAGMPREVLLRANRILERLEKKEIDLTGRARRRSADEIFDEMQNPFLSMGNQNNLGLGSLGHSVPCVRRSAKHVTRTLKFNSAVLHAMVLILVSLPYCIHLGKSSIWDANEAFYAETPREMLVTGDYLAPQFNFQPRVQKPPLTYWIILISYRILGICEFAVRLPSALAAIGTLLFSYGIARLLFSPRAALFSAVITGTTARIFILARRLPIDILLLFFLTGTLFFLIRAIQKSERRSWALAYVFAGLGFLTKGPVALFIPFGTYALWVLWSPPNMAPGVPTLRARVLQPLSAARPVMGLSILLGIVLPWYVHVYRLHGWTYTPVFLRDNLGRFAAESLGPRGPDVLLLRFCSDFFPWSFLLIPAAFYLWIHRKERFLKDIISACP
jgi:hypothetical protein